MAASQETESKNPIQVADRLFQVIETLSVTGPIGLMELSNQLGLNKSTTHRLLTSLSYMGYVRQEEQTGRYQLSFKLLEISGRILNQIDVLGIVHPYIKKLVEQSGETVHLVQMEGKDAVYIDKVESQINSVRMVSRVGSRIPLYCSGVGKAMLSAMPEDKVNAIWEASRIERFTDKTIVTLEELREDLKLTSERGYAMDNEENEGGVRCIAAAVRDFSGQAKYAFSISAPIGRMSDDRIEELSHYVLAFKTEISKELGYRE